MKYLKQRGTRWFVRVRTPKHLRDVVGKAEVVRATGTSDRREAERRSHAILADIMAEFREAEALALEHPSRPTWVQATARSLRQGVQRGEVPEELAGEFMHETIEKHLAAAGLSREALDHDDPAVGRLRAAVDMVTHAHVMPYSQAVETYLEEQAPIVVASTLHAMRRELEKFGKFLGGDRVISGIGRSDAGGYAGGLMRNGKAVATNKKALGLLSTFFNWCRRRGLYDPANPFEGLAADFRVSSRGNYERDLKTRPWSADELGRLVDSLPTTDVRWRLCIIALYTGMRLNEITHLRAEDVNTDEWFLTLPEAKNRNSVRQVPVHPVIQPLVERMLHEAGESGEGWVVVGLKAGGLDGRRGTAVGKRIGRLIRGGLEIEDRRGRFHSLRNTLIHAAENAGVPDSTTKLLSGHRRQSITYGRYSPGVSADVLREAMDRVSYGPLDARVTERLQDDL